MPFLNNIGTTEFVIIGLVLLVLFGGKKLSELARGIGESGNELKQAKNEFDNALNGSDNMSKKKKGGA